MTVLYLVRHGETVANAAQILQGQTQGELNAKGIEQAEEVRNKMRSERFDAFVASDLRRSVRTCEIIPDLRGVSPWPANVETLEAIRARADRFIAWLRAEYADRRVLAVGHGIINKAIQSVYYDKPMGEVPKMGNAEVRILNL